jgi:hypothetical protein
MSSWAYNFEFSVGAGLQYSGILGSQFAIKDDKQKYFVALGLPGASVGMQSVVSEDEKHSVGFSVGVMKGLFSSDTRYGILTYNYHLNGFNNDGVVFGLGAGYSSADEYKVFFGGGEVAEEDKGLIFSLDIGYKF